MKIDSGSVDTRKVYLPFLKDMYTEISMEPRRTDIQASNRVHRGLPKRGKSDLSVDPRSGSSLRSQLGTIFWHRPGVTRRGFFCFQALIMAIAILIISHPSEFL
jgi:hypothetical protein